MRIIRLIERFVLLLVPVLAFSCSDPPAPCTDPWYEWIETTVGSGDGQGHGPDSGSNEWKSVILFRLGLRDQAGVPEVTTREWCEYVDNVVRERY
jgi:hypothetical protein